MAPVTPSSHKSTSTAATNHTTKTCIPQRTIKPRAVRHLAPCLHASGDKTMRVLIVDDYPGVVELYDLALAARGIEVVGAATASEALRLAATEHFDAVVLDVQLPDGFGPELVRRLRTLPSLNEAPIVGMSSCAPKGAAAAFDAFLEKPLRPKRLASTLRRLSDAAGRKLASA